MGYLRLASLLILFLSAVPAWAQRQAFLVDKSGSMGPYYTREQIRNLREIIRDVLKKHGQTDLLPFGETVGDSVNDLNAITTGGPTYLDRAIAHAVDKHYAIAWMITDNIRDTGAGSGNNELFYRKLRSDSVQRVIIFPFVQSGSQLPGIVVYAFLLSPSASDLFDKEAEAFASEMKGVYTTEQLQMKPLNRDIDISFVQSAQPRKTAYRTGEPIKETIEIRFKSKFEHLKIVDAKIEVPGKDAAFSPQSSLKPEKMLMAITPERVSSPDIEKEVIYKVTIDLGELSVKKDLASLWHAATNTSEDVTLNVTLNIQVPQENFRFKDKFLSDYNARDEQDAKATGKIYGLQDLPTFLTEKVTTIIPPEKPLTFRVEYPWWPAAALIVGSLVGLGLLVGLAILAAKSVGSISRPRKWAVTATTEGKADLKCEVDQEKRVLVQSAEVGSISGNTFAPSDGVNVDGGQEKVKLGERPEFKINHNGRAVILSFKEASEEAKAPEQQEYTPTER